ncbi:hypothetical protein A3K73_03595 [Candidatus Pacearchaeota archaeon RBG_13_36_9]|nr:MAG: hypothetical protein A3K73_03595 [Candidatus Pacearchaeota archaeon RBG_13_36_9]
MAKLTREKIDLTREIGFPFSFNLENLETVCGDGVRLGEPWFKTLAIWRSLKLACDCTDEKGNITKQPNLERYRDPHSILYTGRRGVYWDNNDLWDLINKKKIRSDVTLLHSGTIAGELIRTEGHEHLSNFPEIYETINGRGGYLLFKAHDDEVEDVMFVISEKGDHVVFPPGYKHISVNIGETPLVMTDWVSTEANTNFDYIRRHNGGPYWVVKKDKLWFVRNLRYKKSPRIRVVKPAPEISELEIKKGEPMFNLVKDGKIEKLDFLNDTSKRDFYKKAFIAC